MRLFALIIATALLSFAQPSNIVRIPIGEDATAIMRATGAGAVFEFEAGVHRVERLPVESGDVLQSDGGAVLSGAELLIWTSLGDSTYTAAWPYDWGLWAPPTGWPSVPEITRHREVLWVNGQRLTQVLNCGDVKLEQYCVNEGLDQIVFRTALTVASVEAAVRSQLISVSNVSNVTIRGLAFRGTASNYDSSAVVFTNSQNITVENSRFEENNGGGLGIISSQSIATRGNVYNGNGGTGFGASRIIGLCAENETANNNNFRGGWGGFTNWSAAGLKQLYIHNGCYRNIVTNGNASHGFWLDTDTQDISIVNLQSSGNLRYGLFLEAFTGAVGVTASTLANNEIGVFCGNCARASLTDVVITGNKYGVLIGGDAVGRPVTDFVTGIKYIVLPSEFLTLTRVNITGKGVAFRYGTGGFDTFKTTFKSDYNNYYREGITTPNEILTEKLTLSQWQARTGQDFSSTSFESVPFPLTATPTNTATISATFEPTLTPTQTPVSVTATPTFSSTPTAQPTTNAETATPEITQTATPNFAWRFEIVIKGWKE